MVQGLTPAQRCSDIWQDKYPALYKEWRNGTASQLDFLLAMIEEMDNRAVYHALEAAWCELGACDGREKAIFAMLPDVDDSTLNRYVESCRKVIAKHDKLARSMKWTR